MTRRVTDLKYLEAQLQEVEERLQQAVSLLNDLKTVQDKFKDLGSVYIRSKSYIEGARKDLDDLEKEFEKAIKSSQNQVESFNLRFTNYEKASEARLGKLYKEFEKAIQSSQKQVENFNLKFTKYEQASEARLGKLYADSDALVERTQARVDALNTDLATRIEQMRREHDEFRNTVRADVKSAEDNLQVAFRNLRGDVEREGSTLRGDMEKRLAGYRDDIQAAVKLMDANVQEATKRMDTSVQEATSAVSDLKADLKHTNDLMRSTQSSLNGAVEKLRSDLAAASARTRTLTTITYLALVIAVVAVVLKFVMP